MSNSEMQDIMHTIHEMVQSDEYKRDFQKLVQRAYRAGIERGIELEKKNK